MKNCFNINDSCNPCSDVTLDPCSRVAALRGRSAYEIWAQQQPANADTSLNAFLEYLKPSSNVSITDVTVTTRDIPSSTESGGSDGVL